MDQSHLQQQADIDKEIPLAQPDVVKQKDLQLEDQHMVVPSTELKVGWNIPEEVDMIDFESFKNLVKPGDVWSISNKREKWFQFRVDSVKEHSDGTITIYGPCKMNGDISDYVYNAVSNSGEYFNLLERYPDTYTREAENVPIKTLRNSWDISSSEPEIGLEVSTIQELSDAIRPGQVWFLSNPPYPRNKYLAISANQQKVEIFTDIRGGEISCSISDFISRNVGDPKNPTAPYWCNIRQDYLPAKLVDTMKPDNFPDEDPNMDREASEVKSDLYHNIVYTVIPKDHKIEMGIFPEDQHFSTKYVFVWNTYRDVLNFDEKIWQKVSIEIPQGLKHTVLKPMVGGAYSLTHIPNTWHIELVNSQPIYE